MKSLLKILLCLVLLPTGIGFAQSSATKALTIVVSPLGHSVQLSWTGVSGIGTVSYFVYRCTGTTDACITGSTSPGTFAVIASTVSVTYLDTVVTPGASYTYYVTAFCVSCIAGYGGESGPSNRAEAQIPTP